MKATYNVTGAARKELVKVIGSTLGTKPVYKFMPTCAFEIGAITVEKDGTMVWDERTDEDTISAHLHSTELVRDRKLLKPKHQPIFYHPKYRDQIASSRSV